MPGELVPEAAGVSGSALCGPAGRDGYLWQRGNWLPFIPLPLPLSLPPFFPFSLTSFSFFFLLDSSFKFHLKILEKR